MACNSIKWEDCYMSVFDDYECEGQVSLADYGNNKADQVDLPDIEKQLAECVNADQRNWARIYELMNSVEQGELYRPAYRSFTAWVNHTAEVAKCHVSTLWARLKAGRVYAEYAERAAKAGKQVQAIDAVAVSPDTLALCEKVAGKNADMMDTLIEKAVAGQMTREDWREAARAKRAAGGRMATSKYDRLTAADRDEHGDRSDTTATDLIIGLKSTAWLHPQEDGFKKGFPRKYHVFTEFRADTGETRNTRRMDALICETLTTGAKDTVVLRGIEIKVSVSDLVNDHKMQEYTDYCDYFYIAIPDRQEMIDAAESVRLPSWGILVLQSTTAGKRIKVLQDAAPLNPAFRDKTLSAALIKLM